MMNTTYAQPVIAPLHTSRLYHVASEDSANVLVFALMASGRFATMTSGISGWFVETRPAADDISFTDQLIRSLDPTAFVPPSGSAGLGTDRLGTGAAAWIGRFSARAARTSNDLAELASFSSGRQLQAAAS